jgi:hypothetical protein
LGCNPGIYLTCKCRDLGEADSSPAGRGDTIDTRGGPGPGPGARRPSAFTGHVMRPAGPRALSLANWPSALPAGRSDARCSLCRSWPHGDRDAPGGALHLSNRTVAGASPSHRRRHAFCSSFSFRFRGQMFRNKKFRVFLRFALQGKHTHRHRKIRKRSRSKTTKRSLAPFGEAMLCGICIGYIAAFLCFDSVLSFAVACEENILRITTCIICNFSSVSN